MHPQHNQDSNNHPQPIYNNLWVEGLKTLGLSLIFAFGFRTLVAESRHVASGSMLPTLEVNDRDRSYDSRYWGYVPRDYIIGRAIARYWSPERIGTIDPSPLYPPPQP